MSSPSWATILLPPGSSACSRRFGAWCNSCSRRCLGRPAAATIGSASAYIADVAAPQERARTFGMIGMAFGLGPAIGRFLGSFDLRLPFWISAAACLINAALACSFCLSLRRSGGMDFWWSRANPLGSLRLLATRVAARGTRFPLLGLLWGWSEWQSTVRRPTVPVICLAHRAGRHDEAGQRFGTGPAPGREHLVKQRRRPRPARPVLVTFAHFVGHGDTG
jgi:hypothetical protein